MRIAPSALIVKALHAIEEAAWQSQSAPVEPSFALRFALAFLYSQSTGDRDCFDLFWKKATDRGDHHQSTVNSTNIVRSNEVNGAALLIYRALGVYRSTEMQFHARTHRYRLQKTAGDKSGQSSGPSSSS